MPGQNYQMQSTALSAPDWFNVGAHSRAANDSDELHNLDNKYPALLPFSIAQ